MSCIFCQKNKQRLKQWALRKQVEENKKRFMIEYVFNLKPNEYICSGIDSNGNKLDLSRRESIEVFFNGHPLQFRQSPVVSYPGWEMEQNNSIHIIPPVKSETEIRIKVINKPYNN